METTTIVRDLLCQAWCTELEAVEDSGGIRLSMPLLETDGDYVSVWLKQAIGGWSIDDCGSTLMRVSYDADVGQFLKGPRKTLLDKYLAEYGARLTDDGLIRTESTEQDLGPSLLRFGQAMLRVQDLKSWTKSRVSSTFLDDLGVQLRGIVGNERVIPNFTVPGLPLGGDYPVDFAITGGREPLYVFGISSKDKARLSTIVLQYIQQHLADFNSIVVFQDMTSIGDSDMRRLMNVANDIVDSLDASDVLRRKVLHRTAA